MLVRRDVIPLAGRGGVAMEPASVAPAIGTLIQSGVLGAISVLFIYLYLKKDKEVTDNASQHNAQQLEMQREVIQAVNKIADLVEFIEKREAERERERDREVAARVPTRTTGQFKPSR